MSIYGLVFIINLQLIVGLPVLDKPWTPETIDRIYGPSTMIGRFVDTMTFWIPGFFPEYIGANDFGSELKIIHACSGYSNWPWMQIGCFSREIFSEVTSKYQYNRFLRWSRESYVRSTTCQDHARAFRDTLKCLAHPQIEIGYITIPGHILNTLLIRMNSGEPYIYVIDNGWQHRTLYPYNDVAKASGGFPNLHVAPIYNETLTCADRRRAVGKSPTIYWVFPGESQFLMLLSVLLLYEVGYRIRCAVARQ